MQMILRTHSRIAYILASVHRCLRLRAGQPAACWLAIPVCGLDGTSLRLGLTPCVAFRGTGGARKQRLFEGPLRAPEDLRPPERAPSDGRRAARMLRECTRSQTPYFGSGPRGHAPCFSGAKSQKRRQRYDMRVAVHISGKSQSQGENSTALPQLRGPTLAPQGGAPLSPPRPSSSSRRLLLAVRPGTFREPR